MQQLMVGTVVAICVMMTSVSDSFSQCSCYKFYGNSSDWENSRSLCKAIGGDLLSIETVQEWDIINKQLKSKTTDSGADQWWIGLVRKNGAWKWLSNHTLTLNNKWQSIDVNENTHTYAVIDKGAGLFWKTKRDTGSGKICEYRQTDAIACTSSKMKWCDKTIQVSTVPPTQQTTVAKGITTTTSKPSTFPSTIGRTTLQESTKRTLSRNDQEKDKRSVSPKKKPFPILTVVIVLSIVLLACVGILIIVWIGKSKRQGTHGISKRRKGSDNILEVPLSVRHMYDQYPDEGHGKQNVLLSEDEPGFTYFTAKHKNTTKHHANTTKTQDDAQKNAREDAQKIVQEDAHKIVQEDAQISAKQDAQIAGAEDETVSKEKEVAENVGTEIGETLKDNVKQQIPAHRVHHQKLADEFEDEVFYPDENETQQSDALLDCLDQDNSLSDKTTPVYATIDKSKKKAETPQPLYAEINDVNTGDKSKDITYAELTEFQSNSSEPLKKPTPYYPTEYASVTVHPLSPRPFER